MTFLGLLLVTFLIGRVVPIDPVLAVVGDRASAEVYDKARLALGLDLPLWRQFLIYLMHVLRGDFGTSVLTSRPVLDDIRRVFPATLELATVATIIGVLAGHADGRRRRRLAGPLARPSGARGGPDRLLRAGVLARA